MAGLEPLQSVPSRDGGTAGGVGKSRLVRGALTSRELDIVLHHHLDQFQETDPRLPAEDLAGLGWIAAEFIDLGRPEIAAIDQDMAPPVEAGHREGELDEIVHTVRLTGGDDIIVWLVLLQHQPHRLDIVAGKTPISLCGEVSQVDLVLQTLADPADGPGHLARNEGLAATRTFMIE